MSVTLRTRKFVRNPLLQRKQFVSMPIVILQQVFLQQVVDVIHPDRANIPKLELQDMIAKAASRVLFMFLSTMVVSVEPQSSRY